MENMNKKEFDVKRLVLMGLFIALSFVGALIKIQGTIAFDAVPAFFAAIVLGPVYGGIIGLLGHLMTAAYTGFPSTIPVHGVIALMMFISCYTFGIVHKKTSFLMADFVGVMMNGVISLIVACLVFDLVIGGGVALFKFLIGFLVLGAILNIGIAEFMYQAYFKKNPKLWM